MVSDVPLGAFLSGGVDSSAIVAAMSAARRRVSTYTVGFAAEDLRHEIVPDDLVHARRVATLFDTDYHEQILEPNVLELLPKAVWHLEEPVADPAAISTYLICRAARERMPVMLSGIGGDEVFAGYPRYLAYRISPSPRPPAAPRAPAGRAQRLGSRTSRAARATARPAPQPVEVHARRRDCRPLERYLSFSSYYTTTRAPGAAHAGASARRSATTTRSPATAPISTRPPASTSSAGCCTSTHKTFLPCLNLTYTDKMSMAASVEVRVPLLDDELVALAARIPSSLKLHGTRRKYVFKKSQERVLPHDIVWRRKAGFGAPDSLVAQRRPRSDDRGSPLRGDASRGAVSSTRAPYAD